MSLSPAQAAENYVKELESKHFTQASQADEKMECATTLDRMFLDGRDAIRKAIRSLFIAKIVEVVTSEDSPAEKKKRAAEVEKNIDYMKSSKRRTDTDWYISTDYLGQLKGLTPRSIIERGKKEWPNVVDFYEMLVQKFGKDKVPTYEIMLFKLRERKEELQTDYIEEGDSPEQALAKSKSYSFKLGHYRYLSEEARNDLMEYTLEYIDSREGAELAIEKGGLTIMQLAEETELPYEVVRKHLLSVRANLENPDDYMEQFSGKRNCFWIVYPPGIKDVEALKELRSQRKEAYQLAVKDGAKTIPELAEEAGVSEISIFQKIVLMRDEATEAERNPDDYAELFEGAISGKGKWLVKVRGQEGDRKVTGMDNLTLAN